jgi:hypothetical protein
VGYGVGICGFLFKEDMPANVKDYYKRVTERPAYQRAQAVK